MKGANEFVQRTKQSKTFHAGKINKNYPVSNASNVVVVFDREFRKHLWVSFYPLIRPTQVMVQSARGRKDSITYPITKFNLSELTKHIYNTVNKDYDKIY